MSIEQEKELQKFVDDVFAEAYIKINNKFGHNSIIPSNKSYKVEVESEFIEMIKNSVRLNLFLNQK